MGGGEVEFVSGVVDGCAACTGVLRVVTAADSSNRALDPDACDPAEILATGSDLAASMLAVGGGLREIGLIDLDTALDLGLTPFADGAAGTFAQQRDELASIGATLTHIGYVSAEAGTVFAQAGLASSAGASGPGELWTAFWYVFRMDAQNPYEGLDLNGPYRLGAYWVFGNGA